MIGLDNNAIVNALLFVVVPLIVALITVWRMHRLTALLSDRLSPRTIKGWWCRSIALPGCRIWYVTGNVSEQKIVAALSDIAHLYPGWIPDHRIRGKGIAACWEVRIVRPSRDTIQISTLDGYTTLRRLAIGLDLRRKTVTIAAGVHTLIIALTGWGKSNLMATMIAQLLPFQEKGLAQFWCVDLKYGIEAGMYPDKIFTRQAATSQEAVKLLEALLDEMQRRADIIRGVKRDLIPSAEFPRIVLFIDEIGELFNKRNGKDADTAIRLLSSILGRSRALNIVIIAFSQNPRVEAIPVRAGFPQKIAMRLNDETEAEMLLGKAALERGVAPWLITLKGSGYVWNEETGAVSYFRAPFIDDKAVMSMGA